MSLYVICIVPSARLVVPSLPVMPVAADGFSSEPTSTGGQFSAHLSVQALWPGVSFLNIYSVILFAPTRKSPSLSFLEAHSVVGLSTNQTLPTFWPVTSPGFLSLPQ